MPFFFRFIQTATTGIVQTFGKSTRTVGPGLRFFIPFIQKVTPISNRLQQDAFTFEVKTKDNVFTKLGLAIQYRIEPQNTEKAFFSLEDPNKQIDSYIENVVRAKVPKMRLDELFESQDDICTDVLTCLSDKMKTHGYRIENTLVTEIDPASDVKDAMNKINATERLKEAAKNEADANYIRVVKQAEADRDRKRLQGEGISQQRLAILSGYEKGIANMSGHLQLTSKDIIDFVMRTQHLDTIEAIGRSDNTKTIFVNHTPEGIETKLKDSFIQAKEVD